MPICTGVTYAGPKAKGPSPQASPQKVADHLKWMSDYLELLVRLSRSDPRRAEKHSSTVGNVMGTCFTVGWVSGRLKSDPDVEGLPMKFQEALGIFFGLAFKLASNRVMQACSTPAEAQPATHGSEARSAAPSSNQAGCITTSVDSTRQPTLGGTSITAEMLADRTWVTFFGGLDSKVVDTVEGLASAWLLSPSTAVANATLSDAK